MLSRNARGRAGPCIGGVHRGSAFDVSADLTELGRAKMIVVCAGAKAILDLPATLEYLETMSVPVVGYQADEFPAFYSRTGFSTERDNQRRTRRGLSRRKPCCVP
jgi:pseudouridine-5'-phosphate glycosidase